MSAPRIIEKAFGRLTGSREPSRVSPSRPVGFDPGRKEGGCD